MTHRVIGGQSVAIAGAVRCGPSTDRTTAAVPIPGSATSPQPAGPSTPARSTQPTAEEGSEKNQFQGMNDLMSPPQSASE